ncbi:MAG TPA: hypothetical protein VJS43_11690 [Candidatus Acidoferrales bacterium]|nr:hypothetical protein [Candidatus Acidoferrales bacterium]
MCTPTGSPQLTVGAIAGFAAPLNSSPPHRSDNAVRAFVRVTLVAGLVLGSHAMYDFGGYKFVSSDPVFKHAHIAVPGYGMLAFRGVRSDHRGLVGG